MVTKLLALSLLALSLWGCQVRAMCVDDETAQFDENCRTNFRFENDHIFPENWGLLHDSYDSESLLESSPPLYSTLDVDGISTTSQGMWSQQGGLCQYALRTCSTGLTVTQQNQQENWFFTSFIRFPSVQGVDGVQEVFFNISYRFSQCTSSPTCMNDFVTVYKYDTNAPDSVGRNNPGNYQLLRGTVDNSRLQQGGQQTDVNVLWRIQRPTTNGFYLAFKDEGTCGLVRRLIVYYVRNLAYSGTLLTCPSVPLPPQGTTAATTQGTCCCGENAANMSSLMIVCSSDEMCVETAEDVCGCAPGYTYNMATRVCDACPAGMFQPDISITSPCVQCPNNSEALLPASGVCNCIGATIRDPNSPRDPCAESPSSPVLTRKPVTVDGTFVRVCWGAALDSGGLDDLHYNVYVQRTDSSSGFTKVNADSIVGSGEICHEISGLDPFSSYAVIVTSANGATGDPETLDQQLSTVQGRFLAYYVDTGEGGIRKSEAISATFFFTLIPVALITALIVFLIMWFVCVKRNAPVGTSPKTHQATELDDFHATNSAYEKTDLPAPSPGRPSRPPRPPPTRPKV